MSHVSLKDTVEAIELALSAKARAVAREELSVIHYSEIHPKHLVYWLCAKTDEEKQRLESDDMLTQQLREVLLQPI